MTLQIKGLQIAGFPALTIRNLLRGVEIIRADYVAAKCKVSVRRAKQIVETLVSEGYLEFYERHSELVGPYLPGKEKPRYRQVSYYRLTVKGEKLSQASAVSKMSRTRAEQIVAGLLKRVDEVNATEHYLFRIRTVLVYGSYVRSEAWLSDVDIAVDLEPKWDRASKEFQAEREKRVEDAYARGRRFSTRGLSLHSLYDFVGMIKDDNFAYKILVGDPGNIAEKLAQAGQR